MIKKSQTSAHFHLVDKLVSASAMGLKDPVEIDQYTSVLVQSKTYIDDGGGYSSTLCLCRVGLSLVAGKFIW